MELELFGYQYSSSYLLLCSTDKRKSYMFGTTWGRANDDGILIFGWTIHKSLQAWCH